MIVQPSPKLAIANTSAPMTDCTGPGRSPDTTVQWIRPTASTRNITVSTPVTTVITICIRMIRSNPMTPPKIVRTTTMARAITLVRVPPPQPRWSDTVAIASVARITSTVSQPTLTSQAMAVTRLLPRTPNAARLNTIVGADPRFPATPTASACQNERPKSSTNDPYDRPSTETFAANQGQNRSRGLPLRSAPE